MNCKLLSALFLLLAVSTVSAANLGEILSDDKVAGADIPALEAEAMVFDTLSNGIAISVARCEIEDCIPDVNKDELELLIEKLNNRISVINGRYQESGDKALENILLSYASARDNYSGFLDKLDTIAAPAADEGFPEEEIEFQDEF